MTPKPKFEKWEKAQRWFVIYKRHAMGGLGVPCSAPLISSCYGPISGLLWRVSRGMLFLCWYFLQPEGTPCTISRTLCRMTNHNILYITPSKPPTNHNILCFNLFSGVFWLCFGVLSCLQGVQSLPEYFPHNFPGIISSIFYNLYGMI